MHLCVKRNYGEKIEWIPAIEFIMTEKKEHLINLKTNTKNVVKNENEKEKIWSMAAEIVLQQRESATIATKDLNLNNIRSIPQVACIVCAQHLANKFQIYLCVCVCVCRCALCIQLHGQQSISNRCQTKCQRCGLSCTQSIVSCVHKWQQN